MKELYTRIQKKLYYITLLIIIILMCLSLFVVHDRYEGFELGYLVHLLLVILFATCLIIYPKYEIQAIRIAIITIGSIYFYVLFYLYPETSSTFIFLCFIPAISILFFDPRIFYFSLLLNGIFITLTFSYIMVFDEANLYPHIKNDLIGNSINFIASQVILYFLFYLSYVRVKRQQLYFEQVQQTERIRATGQVAAAVAHEIRNPLTVVKGFLQFYEQSMPDKDKKKKHFALMISELNTAEQVISQYLSISKPSQEKRLETLNVKETLKSVTDLLKSYGLLYDNEINLYVEDQCYIRGNGIELKQVLINIIKNAIEASKKGDTVQVRAKKRKEFIEIEVVDRGCGMTDTEIHALGTPFYSLKSKGTGLGLMICYNIVEKFNGTLQFSSSKDEGTTVTLTFPVIKNS
ncbi:sensor histidine kinase [Halalkalibacter urbisdiaboli]|uniref:sensor histidine kinase n=1 Tax=Halalkalibacter urbisdiaboli TaxID=1960589 RepID=UPI000B43DB00|nr:HAMP domain-containing sensor histidine kinase [Halalkalibacter urbisdiaboli]